LPETKQKQFPHFGQRWVCPFFKTIQVIEVDSSSQTHPIILSSYSEGTRVGVSLVPLLPLVTFKLKGSGFPLSIASNSFLSKPVDCSKSVGIEVTSAAALRKQLND